ncbi:hypothetical protein HanIR_Chr09g0427511 [Helianthus annuus]|nr:hypothetical protein HanIR_Chr09g0427511 [Helianthus annuus]
MNYKIRYQRVNYRCSSGAFNMLLTREIVSIASLPRQLKIILLMFVTVLDVMCIRHLPPQFVIALLELLDLHMYDTCIHLSMIRSLCITGWSIHI